MTGDGMCGVFIPDRVLAGWWRSQWKASDRMLGNYPKENILHIEHGESLKSRNK